MTTMLLAQPNTTSTMTVYHAWGEDLTREQDEPKRRLQAVRSWEGQRNVQQGMLHVWTICGSDGAAGPVQSWPQGQANQHSVIDCPWVHLECTNCSSGFYADMAGLSSCKGCPAGKFSMLIQQISEDQCTVCEAGKFTVSPGLNLQRLSKRVLPSICNTRA